MQLNIKRGVRPGEGKVLSYAEEKAADQRIKDFENELMGKEVAQGLSFTPDKIQAVEKWLAHYKKMKSQMGAHRYEGKERGEAEVEIRRIEQRIAVKWGGRIPSYQELWITQKQGIQYLNLVQQWVKHNADREYNELIRRWKYLRRRMEPEDPHADNVLHLFDRR
jgi:hypothetical protein